MSYVPWAWVCQHIRIAKTPPVVRCLDCNHQWHEHCVDMTDDDFDAALLLMGGLDCDERTDPS